MINVQSSPDTDVLALEGGARSCPLCESGNTAPYLRAPDRFHLRGQMYELVRCDSCSLVWLDSPPRPEEMSYHYGTDYHRVVVESVEVDLQKRWRHPRQRVLEMCKGGALLDIGCSSGGFLRTLRSNNWELYGVELSPNEASMAAESTGAQVFVGDVLDAPFAQQQFDVITALHAMEHVYRPQEVIRKTWEWLKPGGVLYLQIPNIEGLEAHIFGSYWFGLELPRHLHHFSPKSLRRLAACADFEEVLVSTLPDCYFEKSFHYILDNVLTKAGVQRTPLALARGTPSVPWRVVRKSFRLGVLLPFRRLSAVAGRGPAIEAAFRKKA
jgi:2-polyprenyl-3-methyl-5-hydroxy-6-metoxy-1,4-benzoquinol methylase